MLEDFFQLSQNYILNYQQAYIRYFLKKESLSNRFSIISGQRGIGKTTAIIQYLQQHYPDLYTTKALYLQADHFLLGNHSLYDIADAFVKMGGELLCIDEIHKYTNWSKELKSIHDTFRELKLLVSGSSALEIHKGSHDLSRRALVYTMKPSCQPIDTKKNENHSAVKSIAGYNSDRKPSKRSYHGRYNR